MRRTILAALPLLAALPALAGCLTAPYPNFAEQLDVANQVSGDSWVASADGPEGEEVKVLVVGDDGQGGDPRFSFTSILPRSVRKLQGTWLWNEATSRLVLTADYEYVFPDESGKPVTQRTGAQRRAVTIEESLAASVSDGRLVLAGGSGALAGTYTLFREALGALGAAPEVSPGCAFRVFNLTILSSQVRIPSFGGTGILQYTTPANFQGERTGAVTIGVANVFNPLTTIDYVEYSDFSGAAVAGLQSTQVNTAGNGYMFGTLEFAFRPVEPLPQVTGTVTYGEQGGGGDSIRLTSGLVSGGGYQVAVSGGQGGFVDGVTLPPPSTAACLGLR